MRLRLIKIHRVIKPNGSLLLPCDYHASHYLKICLDEIFGIKNFQNEITVHYTAVGLKPKTKRLHQNTESILFYSKNKGKHKWNEIRVKYDCPSLYRKTSKHTFNKKTKKIERARVDDGKIKYFIEDAFKPDNVITVPALRGSEKVGYKTQKPEKTFLNLFKNLTNKGDIILDCFGGGGTTAAVCNKLDRKFITGDVSPVACRVMAGRLKKELAFFQVYGMPKTREEWLSINGHQFADKIRELMGWEANPKKLNDGGIDGWAKKKLSQHK